MQDIICEMSETAPLHDNSGSVGTKKLSKAKIFREAITFSKLHYTDDIEVQYPIDAIEFLSQKQFDAEYVQQHIDHIRHLIDIENSELERAINDLQKIINGEELHEDISPRGSRDTILLSSSPVKSSSSHPHPIPDTKMPQTTSSVSFLKNKEMRSQSGHMHSQQLHSIAKNHSNNSSNSSTRKTSSLQKSASLPGEVSFFAEAEDALRPSQQNNNQSKSNDNSPQCPTKSTSSKFRSRLRDAQAELFLADDM